MKLLRSGKYKKPGKKSNEDMIKEAAKEAAEATSDKDIVEDHTGIGPKPEDQTIVETFNKIDDSIYVKVTVWKQMFPWKSNSRSGTPDSVKVPRKDSAKTVDYYKNKTFDY